ncbi:AraC family transcriptional regulator [Polyangium jinanense]|uniref:AraC family transcriptional regulator n=1 Tax=Polyangium jinanense TaxID=2829994 RepID=A0A9X3XFQ5_9BACT|nr:AraC family transcriptional regulator [Polyangium jinanense]MDC3962477.1 AraC family transcriptional regulator [Polyangium jinanense]MDC3989242.1 AraC family transcriptional regulator [Polyangium jinanense]MDC3989579.1 AraC family transcriptional regulator [Polyangium jinanense]
MASSPNKLTDRPGPVDEPVTDVLADVLDAMRLTTLMHGRFELGAPWGIRFPESPGAHIVIVARGSARLEVEGVEGAIVLSAGDLALFPHGGGHTLRDAEGSPLHMLGHGECQRARGVGPIRLGGDGARTTLVAGTFRLGAAPRTPLFEGLPRVIHVTADDPATSPSLSPLVQLLIAESASVSPGATVIMSRLADILFVQALRTHIAARQCHQHGLCALADPQIRKALSLIHERPAEPWTVESLATAVALSRSSFAARFNSLVGEPPLEYLARWRMTKAAQFLREGELPLIEVAESIGYQSEASFNRAFKRWGGVAPGAYRREHRRGERHEA